MKRVFFYYSGLLVITLPFFFCFQLFSQTIKNNDLIKQLAAVPIQSPNVASLVKFNEFPVNKFNGLIDVSFKLYEIKVNDLIVPITLKYHPSGIKVNEEASWVGLGWSLETGGMISHQINGYDDLGGGLNCFNYYFPYQNKPDNDNYNENRYGIAVDGATIFNKEGIRENIVDKFSYNQIDGEPDLYTYNIANSSGRFMVLGNEVVDLDKNNIVFKNCNTSSIDSIIAITPNGIKYKFKDIEKSLSITGINYEYEEIRPKKTAFFLSEIILPGNQKIIFHYKSFKQICSEKKIDIYYPNFNNRFMYNDYFPVSPSISEDCNCKYDEGRLIELNKDYKLKAYTFIRALYLEKIEFPNGSIEFITSERYDSYSLKLTSINVKDKKNNLVKKTIFDYDYFNGLEQGDGYNASSIKSFTSLNLNFPNEYLKKRLKLKSFSEEGKDFSCNEKYSFIYNEERKLPYKDSFSQDFWGYYNGALNKTLIPSYDLYASCLGIPAAFKTIDGANRTVNPNYMPTWSLTGIKHPTGGQSLFLFEPNQCVNFNIKSSELQNKWYAATDIGKGTSCVTFSLSVEKQMDISVLLMKNNQMTIGSDIWLPSYLYVQIEKYSPYYKEWKTFRNYFWGGAQVDFSRGSVYSMTFRKQQFPAGNYRLIANFPDNYANLGCLGSAMANISVQYDSVVVVNNSLVGGLRIKEINKISSDGKIAKIKYTYDDGIIATFPRLTWNNTYPYSKNDGTAYVAKEIKQTHLSTLPIVPFSFSANGGMVGYRKIVEEYPNNNIGRIEYKYSMNSDNGVMGGDGSLPGIHSAPNLLNGFLFEKCTYDMNNKLINKCTYKPSILSSKAYWAFKSNASLLSFSGNGASDTYRILSKYIKTYFYPIPQKKILLDSENEITYYNKNSVSTFKEYKYNSNGLLSQKICGRSRPGGYYEETYLYPYDLRGSSSIYALMVANNIIEPIVQKKIEHKSGLTIQKTDYWQPYTDLFVPHSITIQMLNMPAEKRITYDKYNKNGKLLCFSTDYQHQIVYLWGYNGEYPIAKIEGLNYEQVENALSTSFISELYSTTLFDEFIQNNIRDKIYILGGLVTTYTYQPLVGMTSSTDPSGLTTYYDYDDFNRLKRTYIKEKDSSGNEVEKNIQTYDYHYKNQ